jgi:transcriptional regulator with XRE-family HTH domain
MADRLGDFIRSQRRLANLSIRELSKLTRISNPYLSQVERGIYQPSARVLKAIANALDISAETLFSQAGFLEPDPDADLSHVEDAIRGDGRLSSDQKKTLLRVYRSFVQETERAPASRAER